MLFNKLLCESLQDSTACTSYNAPFTEEKKHKTFELHSMARHRSEWVLMIDNVEFANKIWPCAWTGWIIWKCWIIYCVYLYAGFEGESVHFFVRRCQMKAVDQSVYSVKDWHFKPLKVPEDRRSKLNLPDLRKQKSKNFISFHTLNKQRKNTLNNFSFQRLSTLTLLSTGDRIEGLKLDF